MLNLDGSVDTRGAARLLFGDDSNPNVRRLENWARQGMGPKFFKASDARQCKRWYPVLTLVKFKEGLS